MSAPKGQRIAILVIAAVMVFGTIGSFAVIILGMQNEEVDLAKAQDEQAEYQKEQAVYQAKVDEQAKGLSKEYYPVFEKYKNTPSKFNRDNVKELEIKDLKVGDGKEITDATQYAAYYIGWNPDGKVFDQSFEGSALKAPLDPSAGLIEGWNEGVKGMKIGGIRQLSIPSEKAYGEQGAGDDIPPNTPIKFIIMAIEKPETIEPPAFPESLMGFPGGL